MTQTSVKYLPPTFRHSSIRTVGMQCDIKSRLLKSVTAGNKVGTSLHYNNFT